MPRPPTKTPPTVLPPHRTPGESKIGAAAFGFAVAYVLPAMLFGFSAVTIFFGVWLGLIAVTRIVQVVRDMRSHSRPEKSPKPRNRQMAVSPAPTADSVSGAATAAVMARLEALERSVDAIEVALARLLDPGPDDAVTSVPALTDDAAEVIDAMGVLMLDTGCRFVTSAALAEKLDMSAKRISKILAQVEVFSRDSLLPFGHDRNVRGYVAEDVQHFSATGAVASVDPHRC